MIFENKIKSFKNIFVGDEFSTGKMVIIGLMVIVTTYILTPKYFIPNFQYVENDIAISDIVVDENILLEDVYATNLKKESLIREISISLIYDRDLISNQRGSIISAFDKSHSELGEIQKDYEEFDREFKKLIEAKVSLNSDRQSIRNGLESMKELQDWLNKRVAQYKKSKSKVATTYLKNARISLAQVGSINKYRELVIRGIAEKITELDQKIKDWENRQSTFLKEIRSRRGKIIRDFSTEFRLSISEKESDLLLADGFSPALRDLLVSEIEFYQDQQIIDSAIIVDHNPDHPIYLKIDNNSKDFVTVKLTELRTTDSISHSIERKRELATAGSRKLWDSAHFLLKQLLITNLMIDEERIKEQQKEIRNETSSVYVSLKKGDILAKRGERLDLKNVNLINQYHTYLEKIDNFPIAIGIFLLMCLMLGMIYMVFKKLKFLSYSMFKNLVMIAMICFIHIGVNQGVYKILESLSNQYIYFNIQDTGFYALPIVLAPMLLTILIGFEVALISTIMISILTVLVSSASTDLYNLFYVILSGIFASYTLGNNQSRIDLLIQGMKISLFNIPLVALILLFQTGGFESPWYFYLALPLLSGVLSALFAMFVYPFLEAIFDITTDLKLLELSNMNHPLLKNLMTNAPGSYQHSIMVGNLSEAGALKVGANSLLCRVASYYHDIGKTHSPEYFIENVGPDERNAHDQLDDPYESARQIIMHVTEGEKMARKHRLGKSIIDIIKQHHGTYTVSYFYSKAVEKAVAAGQPASSVSKADFRYPGPKPLSLEAVIVMIADACEASTRSLKNPTKENIEKIIHKVGRNLLSEDQMEQCGISLRDFQSIIKTFTDMLVSLYHKRISYPQDDKIINGNKPAPATKSVPIKLPEQQIVNRENPPVAENPETVPPVNPTDESSTEPTA